MMNKIRKFQKAGQIPYTDIIESQRELIKKRGRFKQRRLLTLKGQNGLIFPNIVELTPEQNREINNRSQKNITSHPTYKDLSRPLSGTDPLLLLAAEYYTGTRGIGAISQWLNSRYLQGLRNRYRETRKYDNDVEQYTGRSGRRENIQFADKETRRLGPIYTNDSNPFGFMYNTLVDPLVRGYSDIQRKYPLLNIILP